VWLFWLASQAQGLAVWVALIVLLGIFFVLLYFSFKSRRVTSTSIVATLPITDTETPSTLHATPTFTTSPLHTSPTYTISPLPSDTPIVILSPTLSPSATNTVTPSQTLFVQELDQCENPPDQICYHSFGFSQEEQLITIKFPIPPGFRIYAMVNSDLFDCKEVKNYPDRFRCEGPLQPTEVRSLIQIFRRGTDQLLAEGNYRFFDTPTPAPDPTDTPDPNDAQNKIYP